MEKKILYITELLIKLNNEGKCELTDDDIPMLNNICSDLVSMKKIKEIVNN